MKKSSKSCEFTPANRDLEFRFKKHSGIHIKCSEDPYRREHWTRGSFSTYGRQWTSQYHIHVTGSSGAECRAILTRIRTLGRKTRPNVMEVQKMMHSPMMVKDAFTWSLMTNDVAAPAIHIITTLYTLIPMYLESFRAGMLTWRVSQARKQPNICNDENEKNTVMRGTVKVI